MKKSDKLRKAGGDCPTGQSFLAGGGRTVTMDFLKGWKKPMKKYAAIDIGTNSMRLLLATIKDGKIIEQKKYINTTRIGSSVDKNKVIGKEGIEKNVEAFCNFVQKAKEYGAEKISAIATSAVREAKNKEELIQTIYQKTGINVKTISGKEEPELGYKGVIMGTVPVVSCPVVLVIDIGGGSTELILGGGSVLKETISLDVGAVRMTERFVASSPIGREEYEKMETEIYRIIDGIYGRLEYHSGMDRRNCTRKKSKCHSRTDGIDDAHRKSKCHPETDSINGAHEGSRFSTPIAIGVGGTITTLAALHQKLDPYDPVKVHNYRLTLEDIDGLKGKLLSLTVRQIKQLKGIHPKRADIIVAGVTILSILMKDLNLKEIRASEYDNLEGMLYDLL